MELDSPSVKEKKNPDEDDTKKNKKKLYWKVARLSAVFGIIEVFSLVLRNKSEDFSPAAATYIRWFADCGFAAGGAYFAHKLVVGRGKRRKCKVVIIWIIWGLICIALPFLKSPPSADESGNPIGLLQPANDPFPPFGDFVPPGYRLAPDVGVFEVGGSNLVFMKPTGSVPIIRVRNKIFLSVSITPAGTSVSGEFFDKGQNVFAVLESNRFVLDRANLWRIGQPDKSTLVITNHQNLEALNIRFCNPHFFRIYGIFEFPDGVEAIASKTNFWYKSGNYDGTFSDMKSEGGVGFGINSDDSIEWGGNTLQDDPIHPTFPK
jgi:TM2 domain-containing membrane protein YozV